VFKSYLSANSSNSAANTDISTLSSGNTTSSTSLQTMKQLICCVDGSQLSNFDTFDTSIDSDENFTNLPQVEYSGLGFLHPLKAHTGDLFAMLLSALLPLNIDEAMIVMVEREKNEKSVYPDAISLDKSLTLTQITGKLIRYINIFFVTLLFFF
jgi:hypothetical protein